MYRTTALCKIEDIILEDTFYKVIQGGMRAGKTMAIMILLTGYAESYPNSKITVVGQSYGHLKDGALDDFKKLMKETNRWEDERLNKTELNYEFVNGSTIQFRSIDKMKAHGLSRDVLFINEANAFTFETFGQLADRTRDFVIIDYNPTSEFWAHKELVNGKDKDRTSFLILTYKDNEALPEQIIRNIEAHKPKEGEEPSNYWTVYGLGQIGVLEGNIYAGWVETTFDDIKQRGNLVRYGLDFGFGHPTGMTAIYEFEDGSLGVVEEIYKQGINSSDYPNELTSHNIDKNVLIVADAARPEIISDIKQAGFRIIGANKDAGSVMRGISRVQERQIYYCGDNIKKEYLAYHWREKRSTGETIYEPEKSDDDLMDSLRYAIDDLKRKRFDF